MEIGPYIRQFQVKQRVKLSYDAGIGRKVVQDNPSENAGGIVRNRGEECE